MFHSYENSNCFDYFVQHFTHSLLIFKIYLSRSSNDRKTERVHSDMKEKGKSANSNKSSKNREDSETQKDTLIKFRESSETKKHWKEEKVGHVWTGDKKYNEKNEPVQMKSKHCSKNNIQANKEKVADLENKPDEDFKEVMHKKRNADHGEKNMKLAKTNTVPKESKLDETKKLDGDIFSRLDCHDLSNECKDIGNAENCTKQQIAEDNKNMELGKIVDFRHQQTEDLNNCSKQIEKPTVISSNEVINKTFSDSNIVSSKNTNLNVYEDNNNHEKRVVSIEKGKDTQHSSVANNNEVERNEPIGDTAKESDKISEESVKSEKLTNSSDLQQLDVNKNESSSVSDEFSEHLKGKCLTIESLPEQTNSVNICNIDLNKMMNAQNEDGTQKNLMDTSMQTNISDKSTKFMSLGNSDYKIEVMSDNAIKVYITRKRKMKKSV